MAKLGFIFDPQAYENEQFEKNVDALHRVLWQMCDNDRVEVERLIRRLQTKFMETVVAIDDADDIEPSFQPKFVK